MLPTLLQKNISITDIESLLNTHISSFHSEENISNLDTLIRNIDSLKTVAQFKKDKAIQKLLEPEATMKPVVLPPEDDSPYGDVK